MNVDIHKPQSASGSGHLECFSRALPSKKHVHLSGRSNCRKMSLAGSQVEQPRSANACGVGPGFKSLLTHQRLEKIKEIVEYYSSNDVRFTKMELNESPATLREPIRAQCREILFDAVAKFGKELLCIVGITPDKNLDRELDKLFHIHLQEKMHGRRVDFAETHRSQLEDSFVRMMQAKVQAGINQASETIPFPTSSERYREESTGTMKYYRQQSYSNRRAYKSTKRGKSKR